MAEKITQVVVSNPTDTSAITPPYPERLAIIKTTLQLEFDLFGELQILYLKIPLLQAMESVREMSIYANIFLDV